MRRRMLWGSLGVIVMWMMACSGETLNPLKLADGGGGQGDGGASGGEAPIGGKGAGPQGGGGALPVDQGALIEVEMWGEVGVLLDEIPLAQRDAVAVSWILAADAEWEARARRQVSVTRIYSSYIQIYLPLPPPEVWTIKLAPGLAQRTTRDGHDYVVRAYTFDATLFTDHASTVPYELDEIGDTKDEKVLLPLDPDLLYHRIAESCVDGMGFGLPYFSCASIVQSVIGSHDTWRSYKRIPWHDATADAARVGPVTNPTGVDLDVRLEGLENHRISYRYFEPDSCAIAEGCVGGPGWRRLLEFDASVVNRGAEPLHFGNVIAGPWLEHNTFFYSPCHQHLHFLFYGDYGLGPLVGDKRAFCLISTSRFLNNEHTTLNPPYDHNCVFQGIAAGWGDDYFIGLDCQWIDITGLDLSGGPATYPLTFTSNPEQFLCEGTPVTDASGDVMFEPTTYTTENGQPIDRPLCDFMPGWDANNSETTMVDIPVTGSFQVQPCGDQQIGPRRNCGFAVQASAQTCTPGDTVTLDCSIADPSAPMIVRVCEDSHALDTTITCSYFGSRATEVVTGASQFTFSCPEARDATEVGGRYSWMTAPLVSDGTSQAVNCTVL